MNSKEAIKKIIETRNPDLDIGEGSGITDILINPLSSVLDTYEDLLKQSQKNLSLSNKNNMTDEELDALAFNFLLSRKEGAASTGTVKILFKTPTNLTIPSGTVFLTGNGTRFESISEYSINSVQMSANIEGDLYSTGPINIVSENIGEKEVAEAREINSIENAQFSYAKVYNELPCVNSLATESNEDFFNRLLSAATSDTALSPYSIKKVISENYDIKDLIVKGFGDVEMVRDLAMEGTYAYDKITSDFFGKRRTIDSAPHNTNFAGSTISDSTSPPDISSSLLNEISDAQYEGLYRKGDSLKSESLSENILNEEFNEETLAASWFLSDATIGLDQLKEPDEIRGSGTSVILGISDTTKPDINITLSRKKVESLQANIERVIVHLDKYILKAIEKQETEYYGEPS